MSYVYLNVYVLRKWHRNLIEINYCKSSPECKNNSSTCMRMFRDGFIMLKQMKYDKIPIDAYAKINRKLNIWKSILEKW